MGRLTQRGVKAEAQPANNIREARIGIIFNLLTSGYTKKQV
jgi:hypothetical protein